MDNKFYLHCDMDENGGWDVNGNGDFGTMLHALEAAVLIVADEYNAKYEMVIGLVKAMCKDERAGTENET